MKPLGSLVTSCRRAVASSSRERPRRRGWLIALLGFAAMRGSALTLVSEPSFTPSTNAPLAGTLRLSTDIPSRVSVSVNDGVAVWERRFHDFVTVHEIPLFGFKPNRTHTISVQAFDAAHHAVEAAKPLAFVTAPLPATFPEIDVYRTDPDRMEPGYTLFRVEINRNRYAYAVIVDAAGEVVWYATTPSTADVRQLDDGNLFMPATNRFVEMNLLGATTREWFVPRDLPIDDHDGVPTSHGTILYLSGASKAVTDFPTSVKDPAAPTADTTIYYQKVVEISRTNSSVLHTWSPVEVLDPRRVSYLVGTDGVGWDAEHSNAILEDPSDDSLIVSMRHQNAVIKFDRGTGGIRWILGPHDDWGPAWQPYLLRPVGDPFVWQYGQHAPVLTAQGTLMMYDNGDYRAMPFAVPLDDSRNYSRAVEYEIDASTMTVRQVWDYGRTDSETRLYTPWEGSAAPLPTTGNVLVDFPAVEFENGSVPSQFGPSATMVRLKEVTHDAVPEVVFDLALSMYDNTEAGGRECSAYRAQRIPDLYAHPPAPVADLAVTDREGVPRLTFSADDRRDYLVETSSDLQHWSVIGSPAEDDAAPDEYEFVDASAFGNASRYYRVVTR